MHITIFLFYFNIICFPTQNSQQPPFLLFLFYVFSLLWFFILFYFYFFYFLFLLFLRIVFSVHQPRNLGNRHLSHSLQRWQYINLLSLFFFDPLRDFLFTWILKVPLMASLLPIAASILWWQLPLPSLCIYNASTTHSPTFFSCHHPPLPYLEIHSKRSPSMPSSHLFMFNLIFPPQKDFTTICHQMQSIPSHSSQPSHILSAATTFCALPLCMLMRPLSFPILVWCVQLL